MQQLTRLFVALQWYTSLVCTKDVNTNISLVFFYRLQSTKASSKVTSSYAETGTLAMYILPLSTGGNVFPFLYVLVKTVGGSYSIAIHPKFLMSQFCWIYVLELRSSFSQLRTIESWTTDSAGQRISTARGGLHPNELCMPNFELYVVLPSIFPICLIFPSILMLAALESSFPHLEIL